MSTKPIAEDGMDYEISRPKANQTTQVKGSLKPGKVTETESGFSIPIETPVGGKNVPVTTLEILPETNGDRLTFAVRALLYDSPDPEKASSGVPQDIGTFEVRVPQMLENWGVAPTDDNVQVLAEKALKPKE